MVDFKSLKSNLSEESIINPLDIFRTLPKPERINDLYTSQSDVLRKWYEQREQKDSVLKLHTGGGKTLVGLLIAQSSLREYKQPVVYLSPNRQLVTQCMEQANSFNIPVVEYIPGEDLPIDFRNSKSILIATYQAFFNGRSRFGKLGEGQILDIGAIVLDDAHSSFSILRDSFTIDIKARENPELYKEIANIFKEDFKAINKQGTLRDILRGSEGTTLEIPYESWIKNEERVSDILVNNVEKFKYTWPLIRDSLYMCHALINKDSISITPILPLVNHFPAFSNAKRRIYMSATITDDSELIRTFDADANSVSQVIQSDSLAGISEKMILMPELMPIGFNREKLAELLEWNVQQEVGSVVLVPSHKSAEVWQDQAIIPKRSDQVKENIDKLKSKENFGPVVFVNRYDGIDLPGSSCRMLILDGLPTGTSTYERFRSIALYDTNIMNRIITQRIEQGIGRASRGSGDYSVVLLVGRDLTSWIGQERNFQFLTNHSRQQIKMGTDITNKIKDLKEFGETINQSYSRDEDWVKYHAGELAEVTQEGNLDDTLMNTAILERKSLDLWHKGYHDKAITKLEKIFKNEKIDSKTQGWFLQLAAHVAYSGKLYKKSKDLQEEAYYHNQNLIKPTKEDFYQPLNISRNQIQKICDNIGGFRFRKAFMEKFESVVSNFYSENSQNQFEQGLCDFANLIGIDGERFDRDGEGPDLLWLLPNKSAFVIEAKAGRNPKNSFGKDEHGQLLVAAEWFKKKYPDFTFYRISIHPNNSATYNAHADYTHVLTMQKLLLLVNDYRTLFEKLTSSHLEGNQLKEYCEELLSEADIQAEMMASKYLSSFSTKSE